VASRDSPGYCSPPGEGDLAAVVEDALRAPGQEHPQAVVLLVKEDEDSGLKRRVLDLEIGFLAGPRLGDHAQLGWDAGERGPEALLDPAQNLVGIHGHGPHLLAAPGHELLDVIDIFGHARRQDLTARLGDEHGVFDADAEILLRVIKSRLSSSRSSRRRRRSPRTTNARDSKSSSPSLTTTSRRSKSSPRRKKKKSSSADPLRSLKPPGSPRLKLT